MVFQLDQSPLGEQDRDYAKALTTCESLADLRALVEAYRPLALDAAPIVEAMTDADFVEFRRGLKTERRGKFAGEKWATRFSAVLMPLPMLRITQLAQEFHAPFGVTWMRAKELRPDLLKVERTAVSG